MKNRTTKQTHLTNYPARTTRPLKGYALNGDGAWRTIPGGALVTVTENTRFDPERTVHTATLYLDGTPYGCDLDPAHFTKL